MLLVVYVVQVLEHVARVNGKLDVLGLDFAGQAGGEGDTARLRAVGLPSYGPAGTMHEFTALHYKRSGKWGARGRGENYSGGRRSRRPAGRRFRRCTLTRGGVRWLKSEGTKKH